MTRIILDDSTYDAVKAFGKKRTSMTSGTKLLWCDYEVPFSQNVSYQCNKPWAIECPQCKIPFCAEHMKGHLPCPPIEQPSIIVSMLGSTTSFLFEATDSFGQDFLEDELNLKGCGRTCSRMVVPQLMEARDVIKRMMAENIVVELKGVSL